MKPTVKLTDELKKTIISYVKKGYTNKEIISTIHVCEETFYKWLRNDLEFKSAIKSAKLSIDRKVEQALLKRALGYKFKEITNEKDAAIEEGGIVIERAQKNKEQIKHIVPDVTAQIFWLKNRQPERWRNVNTIDVVSKGVEKDKNLLDGLINAED